MSCSVWSMDREKYAMRLFFNIVVILCGFEILHVSSQNIIVDVVNASAVRSGSPYFTCGADGTLTGSTKMVFHRITQPGSVENLLASLNNEGSTELPNPNKYNITFSRGLFYFYIKDAQLSDEGQYRCKLDRGGGSDMRDAFLVVSDPPAEAELYWPDKAYKPERDRKLNLTCRASSSRPPASFRWLRDDGQGLRVDYTYFSRNPQPSVDGSGYGVAFSMQEMTITQFDNGVTYKCFIDVPGGEGWFAFERSVDAGEMTSPSRVLLGALVGLSAVLHFRLTVWG